MSFSRRTSIVRKLFYKFKINYVLLVFPLLYGGIGLGEYTTVYDTFLQQSYAFMLEWVLATGEEGGQPLPDFKDFLNVNPSDISV